jgi:MFS family permease
MSATVITTAVNTGDAVPLTDLITSPPAPAPAPVENNYKEKGFLEAASIIFILTGITFISVSGTGILTTALPQIARDINLDNDLLLWPASVYALAAGCTLLVFGAVADIVGSKSMWLLGSGASSFWTLGCGLAQSGTQFIAFRAMLGVFVAMCLPTSMSLVTASFPQGPRRNVAFAVTDMGQPLGYAAGLILKGVLTDPLVGAGLSISRQS